MKETQKNEPGYYAVIPAPIRYNKNLSPNAKLLYGEIVALANKRGYCWATNQYFSDLYDVHPNTISVWIGELKDCKYITVSVNKTTGNNRKIFIGGLISPLSMKSGIGSTKSGIGSTKSGIGSTKSGIGSTKSGIAPELNLALKNDPNTTAIVIQENNTKEVVSIVPDGTSIFSTGDNILVTIGEYEDGDQLAIIEEEPKLPEKPKSAGALLNEALALFQPIFPGDFIGKQTAFSKPPTREAVQALLDRLGMGGIKLLLEKYNNKKSEKFCPLAGTVYEFCTFKLAKIEAYVNKDGGLYAQRSISSPEHRSDLERKIAAKFEASREENRQALKEWLKTHPDDGMRRH